jgi:hypothetical protein
VPALDSRRESLCNSNIASTPLCCAADIASILDLDCLPREFSLRLRNQRRSLIHFTSLIAPAVPADILDFKRICVDAGKQARCCFTRVVRKFYSIWSTLYSNVNRLTSGSLALLPSKFGDSPTQELERIESWNYLKKRQKIGDKKVDWI